MRTLARRFRTAAALVVAALAVAPVGALQPDRASEPPVRPEVIAHRGASAYLPEHTLAGYAAAHAMGADWIEPDLVMTRDGFLICSHEITLEDTTNVANVFPDRARRNGSFYAIDFRLDEIQELSRIGRPGGPGPMMPGHRVPAFTDLLDLLQELNTRTGRDVGIIPEIKDSEFHRKNGSPVEPVLLRTLRNYGYTNRDHRAVIQSFDPWSLRSMRNDLGTDLRLVYLSGKPMPNIVLDQVSGYCDGIGPNLRLLAERDGDTWKPTDLARRARERGLSLWPYTFGGDTLLNARFLMAVPVDGFFIDFPDRGVRAADLISAERNPAQAADERDAAREHDAATLAWIRQWNRGDLPRPEPPTE